MCRGASTTCGLQRLRDAFLIIAVLRRGYGANSAMVFRPRRAPWVLGPHGVGAGCFNEVMRWRNASCPTPRCARRGCPHAQPGADRLVCRCGSSTPSLTRTLGPQWTEMLSSLIIKISSRFSPGLLDIAALAPNAQPVGTAHTDRPRWPRKGSRVYQSERLNSRALGCEPTAPQPETPVTRRRLSPRAPRFSCSVSIGIWRNILRLAPYCSEIGNRCVNWLTHHLIPTQYYQYYPASNAPEVGPLS